MGMFWFTVPINPSYRGSIQDVISHFCALTFPLGQRRSCLRACFLLSKFSFQFNFCYWNNVPLQGFRTRNFTYKHMNGGIKIILFRLVRLHNFWFLKITMKNWAYCIGRKFRMQETNLAMFRTKGPYMDWTCGSNKRRIICREFGSRNS